MVVQSQNCVVFMVVAIDLVMFRPAGDEQLVERCESSAINARLLDGDHIDSAAVQPVMSCPNYQL